MRTSFFIFVWLFLVGPNSAVGNETPDNQKTRSACKYLLKCKYVKAEQVLQNPTTAKEKGLYACIIGKDSAKRRNFGFTTFDPNKAKDLVHESSSELESIADSDALSARILGYLYYFGIGVEKDVTKAYQYSLQAAEKEEAMAMYNIGVCFRDGIGVDIDEGKARRWFLRAARHGNSIAMCSLGDIYRKKKNFARAEHSYAKAAQLGNCKAMFMEAVSRSRRVCESARHKTARNKRVSKRQTRRITNVTHQLMRSVVQAAECGYVPAMLFLAEDSRENNPERAIYWYKKAAQSGLAKPLLHLAFCYEIGLGVDQDKELSDHYYKEACIAAKKQNNTEVLETVTEFRNIGKEEVREDLVSCQGTGFLLSKSGLVATNYHVVENRMDITVSFPKADQKFEADILLKDTNNDLVILKLKTFDYKSLYHSSIPYTLEHSRNIAPGEKVFTLGYPMGNVLGISVKLSTGIISSLSGIQDNVSMFQISNPIQRGNSGGPLFDEKGNVVGIVVSSLNAAAFFVYTGNIPQNVNFAVKSDYLINLVAMLPKGEAILTRKNQLSDQEVKQQVAAITPYIVSVSAKEKQ